MRESVKYDRAVGFFSSSVFSVAPSAFAKFFTAGGKMRLVCSPILGVADAAAIHRAIVLRREALMDLPQAEEFARKGVASRAFAAWLASGDIAMQIALPRRQAGMYHEKIGVFTDDTSQRLAISGSANESRTAWMLNFERVDLFKSWSTEDSRRRCNRIELAFEELWKDSTEGLHVHPVHHALQAGFIQVRPDAKFDDGDAPRGLPQAPPSPPELLCPPPTLRLFEHQELAIRSWAENGGRGILAMATGTGKTITALSVAARLTSVVRPLAVIIVAPLIHLLDQWIESARRFGLRPIRAAESHSAWEAELAVSVNAINAGMRPILSLVVTQATLATSTRFSEVIAEIRAPILIIGDEVHNYGSLDTAKGLPTSALYRLGLSATPTREHDAEGTQRITDYFGPVVCHYGLKEAIRDEVLTPYRYFPVRVLLEEDELEQYLNISRQLARYAPEDDYGEYSAGDLVMRLRIKRARVLASAKSKLESLRDILKSRRDDTHILVYCGDGTVEGTVPDEQWRQVDAAVDLIGRQLQMRCASYTASTPPKRRQELLSLFSSGQLQVLVAIRCLDEGVDIPSTRTAILLASSSNPRQFIQRRGRILRRASGKTRADLFDLLVCPDLDGLAEGSPEYRAIRGMLQREFKRAAEFAQLASNGPIARRSLLGISEKLHLLGEWYIPEPEQHQTPS